MDEIDIEKAWQEWYMKGDTNLQRQLVEAVKQLNRRVIELEQASTPPVPPQEVKGSK